MKLLITLEELKNKKSRELIPIECENCHQIFYKEQHYAIAVINGNNKNRLKYCSHLCSAKNQPNRQSTKIKKSCKNCNKWIFVDRSRIREFNFCSKSCNASYYAQFKRKNKPMKPKRIWAKFINLTCCYCHNNLIRREYEFNQSKSKTFFCSKSCKTKYANKYQIIHKPKSRAESILCNLIKENFPNLEIKENVRDLIPNGLELDIYLPKLKLCIELNGPVHFIPIWGQEKLDKIKNKDIQKQIEINKLGLNLIIIDISKLNSRQSTDLFIKQYFFDYIKPLIEMVPDVGAAPTKSSM